MCGDIWSVTFMQRHAKLVTVSDRLFNRTICFATTSVSLSILQPLLHALKATVLFTV